MTIRTTIHGALWLAAAVTLVTGVGAAHTADPARPSGVRGPEPSKPPVRITMEELHRHGGVPPGWRLAVPPGDPAAGRAVFGKLECYRCHAIRGEDFPPVGDASRDTGPDLAGMGSHHPPAYFLESILNPNAVIVTGTGYTGRDGLSIMPDYRDSLTVGELIDLVAFLRSLTGGHGHPAPGGGDRPAPGHSHEGHRMGH